MNKIQVYQNRNGRFVSQATKKTPQKHSNRFDGKRITEPEKRFLRPQIKNKILKSIPQKIFEDFLASMTLVYIENNEYIYQPGEDIRFLYFPETAVFSEFQILNNGKIIEIMMTGREGITGISSIFNAHPAPNLTQVLQGGQAFRVDTECLKSKLDDDREIKKSVFEYVNLLMNQISQRVVCNGFHSIEERLCTWFLMIQDRSKRSDIKITHEQIAMSLGVHRPSITQITKALRGEKIVDYERSKITIRDRGKLEIKACDCYKSFNQ